MNVQYTRYNTNKKKKEYGCTMKVDVNRSPHRGYG